MSVPFEGIQIGTDHNRVSTKMPLEGQGIEAVELSNSKDDLQHDGDDYELDVCVWDVGVQTSSS